MSRRPVVALAVLAAAAVAVVPAHAATKPKPKPVKGSYNLTLVPDPSPNVLNTVGKPGCGVIPQSQDKHPFKVPGVGSLHVVLDSPNPSGNGTASTDWDLYLLDADGAIIDSSHGGTSHEETTDKFKKKQGVTIWVCNLAGEPNGTVTYTFTYA
jgi:hypothetical protein